MKKSFRAIYYRILCTNRKVFPPPPPLARMRTVRSIGLEQPVYLNGQRSDPGLIRITTSLENWKRSLFSGLAQIILQSTGQFGEIMLTGKSQGVMDGVLKIEAQPAMLRGTLR